MEEGTATAAGRDTPPESPCRGDSPIRVFKHWPEAVSQIRLQRKNSSKFLQSKTGATRGTWAPSEHGRGDESPVRRVSAPGCSFSSSPHAPHRGLATVMGTEGREEALGAPPVFWHKHSSLFPQNHSTIRIFWTSL